MWKVERCSTVSGLVWVYLSYICVVVGRGQPIESAFLSGVGNQRAFADLRNRSKACSKLERFHLWRRKLLQGTLSIYFLREVSSSLPSSVAATTHTRKYFDFWVLTDHSSNSDCEFRLLITGSAAAFQLWIVEIESHNLDFDYLQLIMEIGSGSLWVLCGNTTVQNTDSHSVSRFEKSGWLSDVRWGGNICFAKISQLDWIYVSRLVLASRFTHKMGRYVKQYTAKVPIKSRLYDFPVLDFSLQSTRTYYTRYVSTDRLTMLGLFSQFFFLGLFYCSYQYGVQHNKNTKMTTKIIIVTRRNFIRRRTLLAVACVEEVVDILSWLARKLCNTIP